MRLKIVTYEDLLKGSNKYSTEEIKQIYSNMLDSVILFIDAFSEQVKEHFGIENFKSKVYFDDHKAIQAVLEALDDLKRLKDFHPVKNPNKIKYASYLSYWWLQRKPISIDEIATELPEDLAVRLYNFNEFFLVTYVLNELFNKDSLTCNCGDKLKQYDKQWAQIQEYLFYFFCYRAITPKSIEAFLIGSILHPIWDTNEGVTVI